MLVDVIDRRVERVDNSNSKLRLSVFAVPRSNSLHIAVHAAYLFIPVDDDPALAQMRQKFWKKLICDLAVHQNGFDRIACCRIVELRIVDDSQRELLICAAINIDVTDALRMPKYRNPRVRLH